ncbi:PepSY domain-containing protein [Patescibacteria group bacterium]|nr:PepSY domain-containing protein [Patescibacteria group bacterium]
MTKKTFSFLSILVILVFALAATVKPALAGWSVNSLGWLVYEANSNVLGDKDEVKKEERKQEIKKEENNDQKREVEYFDAGQNAWIKAKTEIKSLTGEESKTETERNRFKLKLKSEAGILKLEAESENGEETELGEDEEIEIEAREDQDDIKISTGSGDELTFTRNRVRARTHFPLSVDLATNELIVTTPNGVKRVAVLPDQAIANLLANDVIDRVVSGEIETEVELTEEDGNPAYEVSGESDQKFLGFMPVKIKSKVKVSAETGEVLSTEKSIFDRLIDLVSF